jgi:hypothetical protein
MSNVGKWSKRYSGNTKQIPYGNTVTYAMAAEFLDGMTVEDWGCGYAWFKTLHNGEYIGVDGTQTQWSDVVDDLSTRKSSVQGIMMRHVLEHNSEWEKILSNVLDSAQERIALIVFTPNGKGEEIGYTEALDIYDYAINHATITKMIKDAGWTAKKSTNKTETQYGVETVWLAERNG